ncbi:MAG: penicillin-binding transpeptidase domain-containing protein [Defluviitaleaceae bacterium]|nr:penicillin-binding transpeptidase domain-containing protein [Defluviitaleaceae bacterium]MCL2275517.1 penicillin-binding transpeptidase domain-containing protein [Defluviitaleaceae bacterium]
MQREPNAPRRKPLPTATAARRRNRRMVFIGIIFTLILGYLLFYMGHIMFVRGDELNRMSSEWRTTRMDHLATITPYRGWIMDRNMQTLAGSHPVFNIALDLPLLAERENISIQRGGANRIQWMDDTLTALHEALDIPLENLRALFVRDAAGEWQPVVRDNWRIIAWNIPANIAIPLRDNLRDVYLEEVSQRMYPDPFFAPQVLGFLRGDAQWGLEGHFHHQLSGISGRMFRAFDADNTLIRDEVPVQHGHSIITTLDADIQRLAQAAVDDTFATIPSDAVALIVMNPNTGEILAMAQAPNFSLAAPDNPAFFTDPSIYFRWEEKTEQEQVEAWMYMWRNYHITRSFEPGSIFKPVVVAAALEEGVISTHDVFFCNGVHHVEGIPIECFNRIAHGSLTVSEALAISCNVAMIQIMQRLGQHQFYRYRGYFGYGERTGIDLPGEDAVSSPLVMYALNQLGPVQLATSSIGQGFNNTTIQAATSFAALINGGNMMRPFIVSQIIDANNTPVHENRPQVIRRAISQETSDWIRVELEQVVIGERGTGRQTRIPGHTIGGKTGTAQQGILREDITIGYWIYTPVENPEFLIFMVIDHVQESGRTAGNTIAPILRVFLEDLIILRNLPPSEGEHAGDIRSPVLGLDPMPDFTGYRVTEVVRNLINRNIAFQVNGGGTVVTSQFPAAGRSMPQPHPAGIPVQIFTDPATYIEGRMTVMPHVEGLNAEQAHNFIRDAMLQPVMFGGEGARDEYEVYRQFPAAGAELEQGMHVMLRVRPR